MKNKKLNLALIAVLIAGSTAFATVKKHVSATIYQTSLGVWEFLPGGSELNVSCDLTENVYCKGTGTPSAPVEIQGETGFGTDISNR